MIKDRNIAIDAAILDTKIYGLTAKGDTFYVLRSDSALYPYLQTRVPSANLFTNMSDAITACTANHGDVIKVMPTHTESIIAAAGVACATAGVSIMGYGEGDDRPKFTFSTVVGATWTISAASVSVKNIIAIGNKNLLTNPFVITGNAVTLDIEYRDTSAILEALSVISADTVSNLTINLVYKGFTAGTNAVNPIKLKAVTNGVININAYGVVSTAWVNFITTLSTNILITGSMYTQAVTNFSRDVVDTIGSSTWYAVIDDMSFGGKISGGSAAALASDDVSAVSAQLAVPTQNAATNTNERDVIGNKTDTVAGTSLVSATLVPTADVATNVLSSQAVGNKTDATVSAVGTTKSLMAYVKGILNSNVLITGTFTTSSATVPADTGRTEANDYWKGCLLIPLTGAIAYQPRLITGFANAGGVFTLDVETPFTAVPGTVLYAIVRGAASVTVPIADASSNGTVAHVVGNKSDAAVTTVGTTASILAYAKGLLNRTTGSSRSSIVSLANTDLTGTVTRFTITNGPIIIKRLGLLVTTAIPAGANTLKLSFTPTGGGATDLCGTTDTASAGAQQLFVVDGTKATAIVKTTDVGIWAAGQVQTSPLVLGSGVLQTIFSAGAPASGAAVLFMEWESLNPTATVA